MKNLMLFFLLLAGLPLFAQTAAAEGPALAYRATTETETLTSFKADRERTLLGDLDLTGIWGGPTYNYSSSGEDWAFMRGGFGGLEFGEEFFVGYGGWASRDQFNRDVDPTESTRFDFRHGGVIIAYSPFRDNAVHPRLTTIIGPGRITDLEQNKDRFLVGQAALGVEFNLFQWLRLGVDGGYRFASGVDLDGFSDNDVSGSFFQIEARFGFSW